MQYPGVAYDPHYLAGILVFNRQDYFEAHEVWEDLWTACAGPERRFYQALIQAAVALYHFGNGNWRGAIKLFNSSKAYMAKYPSPYLGLDINGFWKRMERCFADLHGPEPRPDAQLDPALIPVLTLDPPPDAWPDLSEFLHPEE